MHYESELLQEVRCLISAFGYGKIAQVGGREPVQEPELEHEGAADLLVDLGIELLLSLSAQAVYSSHLGELQSVLHVLEWTLEQQVGCSKHYHQGTVLAAS